MKKIFGLLLLAGLFTMTACGPKEGEGAGAAADTTAAVPAAPADTAAATVDTAAAAVDTAAAAAPAAH